MIVRDSDQISHRIVAKKIGRDFRFRHFLGQERDPTPPVKPKQEPEDILDLDRDYSTAERKKACK